MSKLISISAAGALALGAVGAHASIALPSSGSSDAILFAEVLNSAGTAAVASFAGDTGVSINTILSGGGSGTYLASDGNLAKLFAADVAGSGDTISFAVLGGQYTGSATTNNFKTAGVAQFLTTTNANSTTALTGATTANLVHMGLLNTDIGTINSNSGGASSIEGVSPGSSGVWDVVNTNGIAYWDGANISNANDQSVTANLFYATGGGSIASKVSTVLEGTASLSASGLVLAQPNAVMPLPAAVWLLGSGLVGLAGVARRKTKAKA